MSIVSFKTPLGSIGLIVGLFELAACMSTGSVTPDEPADTPEDTQLADVADLGQEDEGAELVDIGEDVSNGDLTEDEPPFGDVGEDPIEEDTDTPDQDPWVLAGCGTWEDPFVVDRFPFVDLRDTSTSTDSQVDAYSCAPEINESGPEFVYRLVIDKPAIVFATVDEDIEPDVDVDLHLLRGPEPNQCIFRHHYELFDLINPEDDPYLVVDTWVDSEQNEYPGVYQLDVTLQPLPSGNCLLERGEIELYNRDEPLPLPAIGEVVREAHLVTTEEFPDGWPTSARDGIEEHYTLSESVSGYVMDRDSDWAPEGEGGCEWGDGAGPRPPVLDEAWYVNMYWRERPPGGTRMLVFNPVNRRGVVTSGGYETGPGSAERIGGACEEIHHSLQSTHRSRLLMAFLVDQTLPLGPVVCE